MSRFERKIFAALPYFSRSLQNLRTCESAVSRSAITRKIWPLGFLPKRRNLSPLNSPPPKFKVRIRTPPPPNKKSAPFTKPLDPLVTPWRCPQHEQRVCICMSVCLTYGPDPCTAAHARVRRLFTVTCGCQDVSASLHTTLPLHSTPGEDPGRTRTDGPKTHAHVHTHYTRTHTYTHARSTHTRTRTCTHAYIRAHMHTHTHACTHAHAHTHVMGINSRAESGPTIESSVEESCKKYIHRFVELSKRSNQQIIKLLKQSRPTKVGSRDSIGGAHPSGVIPRALIAYPPLFHCTILMLINLNNQ